MPGSVRIKVLPEKLANKIAAGEVVERPASVVKELMENSLDAGAAMVRVETEAGGRRLIRVTDDGMGMTPDEALLAVERHATSKISTDKDLFNISTLGFRGEALPSIASVSRFELLTRSKDLDEGVRVKIEGGTIDSVEPAGCAPGTVVTIRNLFYNVPARLKFLRSQSTELGHISDVVSRIALANPKAHFQLYHDNREVIETPPSGDYSGRISDALGSGTFKRMREVGFDMDGDHRVHGFVSLPDISRSSGAHIYTYVNGRFIRDRVTNHAIIESYRSFLPKGRYPLVVLFIEVPPGEVDVNVHPAKAEVRFREAGRIHDAVRKAVIGAFEKRPQPAQAPAIKPDSSMPQEKPEPADGPRESTREALKKAVEKHDSKPPEPLRQDALFGRPRPVPAPPPSSRQTVECDVRPELPRKITPVAEPRPEGYFQSFEILGQLKNTYLVCQSNEGLVLIDQHAAHERTAFERLKKEYRARSIQKQALLFPETLELGLKEAREMNRFIDVMGSLGFEIEPFGGKSFLVRALPALLGRAEPKAMVLDLLDALSEMKSTSTLEDRLDEVFARLSCHAVIRAGKSLSIDEMKALLKSLDNADFPLTCPHGRPICIRITYEELESMFGRR